MFYIYRYTISTDTNDSCGREAVLDSCMVGIRSYRTCVPTAPDSSDPGEYPEEDGKYRKCESKHESVAIQLWCS